jgi:hypothetical protein
MTVIKAKSRLKAFRLIPQAVAPKPGSVRGLGERYKDQLQWVEDASPDPALTVGYMDHFGAQLVFYVFYSGKCVGAVTFDFLEGGIVSKGAGLRIMGELATPHAVLDPIVRSKGIVSFLYKRALKSGMTLVSETHTDMATSLWVALSKQPGINFYHFEAGTVVPTQTPNSIKILTTKRMKTHG